MTTVVPVPTLLADARAALVQAQNATDSAMQALDQLWNATIQSQMSDPRERAVNQALKSVEAVRWKSIAEALWLLLDNISTLDDACRSDDAAFRAAAMRQAERRRDYLVSEDGQTLKLALQAESNPP